MAPRAPAPPSGRRAASPAIAARLLGHVTLEAHSSGQIRACFDGYSLGLGTFGIAATERAEALRTGLPLASFVPDGRKSDPEIDLLVRRLAANGLLEYRLGPSPDGQDIVVIEPQVNDYWPRTQELGNADRLVLSRFAYMRRRGDAMVLESPCAGALFRICDPNVAMLVASLATPQPIRQLRRLDGFPGLALFALLTDAQILLAAGTADMLGRGTAEDADDFAMWEFHDLLFHTRSTEGRHANPIGGLYPHTGAIAPLPPVRPPWPGKQVDLGAASASQPQATSAVPQLLRQRHSTRSFDDERPITLAETARLLDSTARILSHSQGAHEAGDGDPADVYTIRPYPTAGASYELELYLAVHRCEGLARGFYHYDSDRHALVPIDAPIREVEALLARGAGAMGAPAPPQILITIAARFGRVSWKYSGVAYALVLKDVGVLTQTLYLSVADMGLGGCAIGIANIDHFAKLTGLSRHVEGPVGQFAIGRPAAPRFSDDGIVEH